MTPWPRFDVKEVGNGDVEMLGQLEEGLQRRIPAPAFEPPEDPVAHRARCQDLEV